MDPTQFPFIFPQFPSSEDDRSVVAGGLSQATLAVVIVIAVVLIVGIVAIVACCFFRRKNMAVRIGNEFHMIATEVPMAPVNDA